MDQTLTEHIMEQPISAPNDRPSPRFIEIKNKLEKLEDTLRDETKSTDHKQMKTLQFLYMLRKDEYDYFVAVLGRYCRS